MPQPGSLPLVHLAMLLALWGPLPPLTSAHAADSPAAAALLERARLWASRDRPDLAREALQRLERVAPDHPEALALQAELDLLSGDLAGAQARIARLRTLDAGNANLERLESLLRVEGTDKARLRDARLLAKAGRTEAAIEAWRRLFPSGPPSGELAFEYLQLLGSTSSRWSEVLAGLQRLTQQHPESQRYGFALAEHELSRSPLNLAALRRVIEMSSVPEFTRQAQSAWRRAMLRQDPSPQAVTLLREYLDGDGADTAVREKLDAVLADLDSPRRTAAPSTSTPRPAPAREPDAAQRAGLQGQAALGRGDLPAAEELLEASLAQRPDDADVVGALGTLRLRQGRHAQAQAQFDRAAQLDRDNLSKWRSLSRTAQLWGQLRESDEALDRGDAAGAERLAAAALRLDPREPEALVALARAQWRLGKLAPAEANLRSALRIDPVHRGAFRSLAALLTERDDRATLIRLIAALTPSQREAFATQIAGVRRDGLQDEATRLAEAGRSDEAMTLLRQAIELDPSDAWLRYKLAQLHAGRGEVGAGRALLAELARGADVGEALHALALYESQLGNDLEALQVLERIPAPERSAGMTRTQRRLWFRLQIQRATAAARQGERGRAAHVLREIQAAASGDLALMLDVAGAWVDIGDPVQAQRLTDTLPWTPDSPVGARLRHARLMLQIGAFDALPPLLRALAAAPGLDDAQQRELRELRDASALQRARRLRELGSLQAAIATLRERIDEPPARAPLLLAQAELLREAGRPTDAIGHYRRAIAADPSNDDAYQALVLALMGAVERAEAQRLIDARLNLAPPLAADLDTQVAMAGALVEMGQWSAARQAFEAMVAASPGHARAWRQLAQLDLREGRVASAVENYQRAAAAEHGARSATGAQLPISRLALAPGSSGSATPVLQVTYAENAAAEAEIEAWRRYRPIASLMEQQGTWWAGAVDYRWRSGTDGLSQTDMKEMPIEYGRSLGGTGRLVLRADLVQLDAGGVTLADAGAASDFGSLLLCLPACGSGAATQRDSGLAVNAAYERDGLRMDVGTTPLGFAVQRPVGGLRFRGDLGKGSYSVDLSSRPLTSSLLSYAGTRDPRTGTLWGGVQASGVRLGMSRDEGLALGLWSSFGLHQLHGKNVQGNLRRRAMGGVYWRLVNDERSVLSVGVNGMLQGFQHNAGEFTFGHGGYYSPQSYRSISLPVNLAHQVGRWSFALRASISRSSSRTDAAPFYPTDPAMQAAAEALAPVSGIDPNYRGGRSTGTGHSLAAGFEAQWRPQWFFGGRFEIDRSEDYAPNRALVYLRFAPHATALRRLAFPPEPVQPTSEY